MSFSYEKNNGGGAEHSDSIAYVKSVTRDIAKRTDDPAGFLDTINAFARNLKTKYPDALNRKLWHALVGSTPYPGVINEEDYERDDSIVKFVETLSRDF